MPTSEGLPCYITIPLSVIWDKHVYIQWK